MNGQCEITYVREKGVSGEEVHDRATCRQMQSFTDLTLQRDHGAEEEAD